MFNFGVNVHPSFMQQVQQLSAQLRQLIEQVRSGAAAEAVVAELQSAIAGLHEIETHDELTSALNRRGLLQRLQEELMRARRTGHPFSFAVIAVDELDAIDLRYGGDTRRLVLRSVAQAALTVLRSLDSVGRIDEHVFGIILPTTWLDQSDKAIARLTKAVSSADWGVLAPSLRITFSSGITTNAPGDTADEMLRRAGDALLQAQQHGRGALMQLEPTLPDILPDMP
jgi:diguanylate cyclase (GGDEF)-like protein